jgi:hypothetical protein
MYQHLFLQAINPSMKSVIGRTEYSRKFVIRDLIFSSGHTLKIKRRPTFL